MVLMINCTRIISNETCSPLLPKLQYVDRRCVIAYLIEERYPLFEKTSLFLEYLLCCRLRDVEVDFESKTFKGISNIHLTLHEFEREKNIYCE